MLIVLSIVCFTQTRRDMISFAANGLVFFWSGIASVNFFIRSLESYDQSTMSLAAIPLIYIFMMLIRTGCVALFNPLFKALGQGLSVGEVFFVGWAGLRGSVSLIMVSAFASGSRLTFMNTKNAGGYSDAAVVSSDISLWVPCFVVLTLVINGPTIAPVLRLLRLNRVPLEKQKMRAKAKRGLCRFTDWQLADLRENEDEFLQGEGGEGFPPVCRKYHCREDNNANTVSVFLTSIFVILRTVAVLMHAPCPFPPGANWDAVAQYVDMSNKLRDFDMPHDKGGSVSSEVASQDLKTASGVARVLWRGMLRAFRRALLPVLCCFRRRNEEVGEVSAYKKKAKPKESGSPPEDSAFDSSSGGGDPGGEYSAPRPFSLSAISMGLWRDSPPSGESEERDHDAWSDVSATDLAADLAEECPFLLRQSAAAFLPRGSMAYPADGAGGDGSNGDGDVDLELGLQRDTAMEGLSNGVAQPVAEMETFLSISGKRGSTSNLMTITEGQPAHHPDPEPPTTAAAAAPADGEMCISGTASAKLLKELRQALSSERNGTADVPGYYASVPGPVGAQMRQELAAELEQDRPATQGPSLDDDEDLGGGGKTAYYSSLPTAVGRQLQNELRAALGVSGTHRRSASGGGSGPSSPPQSPRSRLVSQFEPDTEPAQKPLGLERLSSAARSGAASPRAGPGNAAYLDRTSMSATASMPAAVGRLMQAQLKARMLQRDSAPGSPNGSRASSPRAGSVPPPVEWDSYHATVSGVAGSNLAAEVRHHLRKPSLGDEPTRDLLGRRLPPRSGVTSPFDLPPLPPAPLSARGAPPVHASMHARSASM